MKMADNFYPSHIAKILAHEVGLLKELPDVDSAWKWDKEVQHLIEFQQLSLVASFDECLTVYFGIDLSEKQLKNLKLIYEVTPKLLPGNLFLQAMNNISGENTKEYPDMNVIVTNLHIAINQLTKKRVAA